MENFLVPLSFTNRRAPIRAKVRDDGERMYRHASYVIVLNDEGKILETRKNRRQDDQTIDCLVVLAPVLYREELIEKSVVLEIGFRKFVPYVEAEYYPNGTKRFGPVVRLRKGEERRVVTPPQHKQKKERVKIPARVRVAQLSEHTTLELLGVITNGIQECVDEVMYSWENSPVRQPRGIKINGVKHEFDHEMTVIIRLPKEESLLCAAAYFAELRWRTEPTRQLTAIAASINQELRHFMRFKKPCEDGSYEDDVVKKSGSLSSVASKIRSRVRYAGYSSALVAQMLELIGPPASANRNLLDQVWRIHKIPNPDHTDLEHHLALYAHLEEKLKKGWALKNYRSLRLEKKKKEHAEKVLHEHGRVAIPHGKNSVSFSVFGSKKAVAEIMARFDKKESERIARQQAVFREEDGDVLFGPTSRTVVRTGTDDDCPF